MFVQDSSGIDLLLREHLPGQHKSPDLTTKVSVQNLKKEKSLCHKLYFNPYIVATRCRRPQIFLNYSNFVRSKSLSLKYQKFTPSGLRKHRNQNIQSLWKKFRSFRTKLSILSLVIGTEQNVCLFLQQSMYYDIR